MVETVNGTATASGRAPQLTEKTIDEMLAFAQPAAVYSAPVVSGAYTTITVSEVMGGGGFGYGTGSSIVARGANEDKATGPQRGDGGGGGGGFYSRPLAAIVIGPDGVKVQPIPDATRIAIAAITAWAGIALMAIRLARASKFRK